MRAWTRKNSLGGLKLRSEMDAHEAAVLRSLVTSVSGLLEERAASADDHRRNATLAIRDLLGRGRSKVALV